jgi:hypothetical protein
MSYQGAVVDEEEKERASGAAVEPGPAAAAAAPTDAAASQVKPGGGAAPSSMSWQHVGLLWAACGLTVGAYYSKDVLAAVSPDVSLVAVSACVRAVPVYLLPSARARPWK